MTTEYLQSVSDRYLAMSDSRLPASYAAILLETVGELLGEVPAELLELLSRPRKALDDPHVLLPLQEYITLYARACQLSQSPLFGLKFGHALGISSHGVLGMSALTSSTLRTALALLVEYANTYAQLFRFQLIDHPNGNLSIRFRECMPLYIHRRQVMETLLATLVRGCRDILPGVDPATLHAQVEWAIPSHHAHYKSLLGVQVEFDQPNCSLNIAANVAHRALPYADIGTHQYCLELLERIAVRLQQPETLLTQVTAWLSKQPAPLPAITRAAAYFSMSPRSFRKRLFDLGCNYRDLANREIMARAHDLLTQTDLSVGEIADRLGFSEGCNFSRAFSRETGQAPLLYRHAARSERND